MAKTNQFKEGSTVKIKAGRARGMAEGMNDGDVVTVTRAFIHDGFYPRVEVDGHNNGGVGYNEDRFELVVIPNVSVGDRVRVVRIVADHDKNGMGIGKEWHNSWTNSMDSFVGKTYTVTVVHERVGVELAGGRGYDFPLLALELVEAKKVANGVDGNGLPIHFTEADLKPGMRVVTNSGRDGIIYGNHEYDGKQETAVVYEGKSAWDIIRIVGFKEVYEAEVGPWAMLNPSKRGNMLFKVMDFEQLRKQSEADAAVVKAKAALEAAEAARKALN